jgi:hypothetical protein
MVEPPLHRGQLLDGLQGEGGLAGTGVTTDDQGMAARIGEELVHLGRYLYLVFILHKMASAIIIETMDKNPAGLVYIFATDYDW